MLPPLVVTRMDCESRIHTVFSSCPGSDLTFSVEAVLERVVIDEAVDVLHCRVLAGTLQSFALIDPTVFRASCGRWGETKEVLLAMASFSGATW